MNNKNSIIFVSPGWPANVYANGIATYIHNIIEGIESSSSNSTQVLALSTKGISSAFNVEEYYENKFFFEKLQYLLYSKINFNLYSQNITAKHILYTIKHFGLTPKILEIEESFGVPEKLIPMVNFPVVTRLHGPWFIHGPIYNLNHGRIYNHRVKHEGRGIAISHGITAPSLDVLNRVRDFYDLELKNAVVIPNPVPSIDKELHWQPSSIESQTILFVGRFDAHKGGDIILNSFRHIALKNKEVKLVFVGPDRGIAINGSQLNIQQYINTFIPELSIRNRINFMGSCQPLDISKLRKSSTITLVASRYENFPMTLLECLSYGSPVIAPAVGGIKEIISNNFNGILYEPESTEDLANKALHLLENPELMKSLSQNAIDDCQDRFNVKLVAKQTLNYYRSFANIDY